MGNNHALLTAREISGPYMQMLTNLQGENGQAWLEILKKVNRRENPFPISETTYPTMEILELAEFDFDTIDETTVKSLGRTFYGDESILRSYPKPQGKQGVKISLFHLGKTVSCQTLAEETKARGLTPNPWHLLAYALKNPGFADNRCIVTQWQDDQGRFCYAEFRKWRGNHHMDVGRRDRDWYNFWSFAGCVS